MCLLLLLAIATPAAASETSGGNTAADNRSNPNLERVSTDKESLSAIAGLEAEIDALAKTNGPFADSLF